VTANQTPQETTTKKWSRLYGTLYTYLGTALVEGFGEDGERVLRRAVHDYGAYRASWVRAKHEAQGLALNLANMMNFGDMPNADSLEKEGRVCTPTAFRVTVTECIHHDTWSALDSLRVGRIYCEEVHGPLYCEYAEGVTLDLSEFLTKGDDVCTFVLTLPNAPEPAAQPSLDEHPETKIARLYGVLFCFLGRAFIAAFGDEGENALRNALREYARQETASLTADQLAYGWERNGSALRPAAGYATLAGQAVYEAWREVEGDEIPIGLIYFQEIHKAMN
jgi:hypothetical protein